ncbi:MAG: hypothetical protein NW226_13530 [Microscillaceae bacterium]|nr:hypothetical protein [Microscillaceae bacterium]
MEITKTEKENIPKTIHPSQLNIYDPKEIMAVGGIALFSKMIGNDKPIPVTHIEFTEEEWDEIDRILDID